MTIAEQEHHSEIAIQELLQFKGKTKYKNDYQQWLDKYNFLFKIVPDHFFNCSDKHPFCNEFSMFHYEIFSFLYDFDKKNSMAKTALSEYSESFATDEKSLIHWLIKFKSTEYEINFRGIFDNAIDDETNISFLLENETDFTDMIRFKLLYYEQMIRIGKKYKAFIKVDEIYLCGVFNQMPSEIKDEDIEQHKKELLEKYGKAFLQDFHFKMTLDLDRILEKYF